MSMATSLAAALLHHPPLLPTLLVAFLVPLALLVLFRIKRGSPPHEKAGGVPPSPPKLPLLGNIHQLFGSSLHRSLHGLAQKYGPFMLLHLGQVPTLVASTADAAREILGNHDRAFAGRPVSKGLFLLNEGKDLGFQSYGRRFKLLRKICSVHLLSNTKVQTYWRLREEEVASMIRKISAAAAAAGSGRCIDMSEILYAFSNDVLCRVVSGKFSREEGRNALFRELIGYEGATKFFFGDLIPRLGWLDALTGNRTAVLRHKQRWWDLLDRVIEEHVERAAAGAAGDYTKDFVDVLLDLQKDPELGSLLTPANMKYLLMDMFIGGTDTSHAVLEFGMAHLMQSPQAMKRLQEEVRGIAGSKEMVEDEDVKEMTYVKAVVKEVLRLHPPVPYLVPHQAMEDVRMKQYKIEKETQVFVNAWAVMRDPEHWESPHEFVPERFLDGVEGAGADFRGGDFHYIPFGAGRRICPGMQFAVPNLELALANLVHRFDWEPPEGVKREEFHVNEAPGMMMRRDGRLLLVARPRTP